MSNRDEYLKLLAEYETDRQPLEGRIYMMWTRASRLRMMRHNLAMASLCPDCGAGPEVVCDMPQPEPGRIASIHPGRFTLAGVDANVTPVKTRFM